MIEYPHQKQMSLFYSNPHGMRWRRASPEIWTQWFRGDYHAPNWEIDCVFEVEPIPEEPTGRGLMAEQGLTILDGLQDSIQRLQDDVSLLQKQFAAMLLRM